MNCPNCKCETNRITTVCDDDGHPFSFCPQCPRPASKKVDFPAIISGAGKRKRGRPPKQRDDSRYTGYEMTSQEIAETQRLRPRITRGDSEFSREIANVDKIKDGSRTIVYVGGNARNRAKVVNHKISAALGTDGYKIIADDGVRVVADIAR